ncbi:MAG: family beta-propeller repeat protein [Acidimicrobiales bacterium]|nr:family beta-propeller repeat protein [Acidimicrobiales bacterium]
MRIDPSPVYVRRRRVAGWTAAVVLLLGGSATWRAVEESAADPEGRPSSVAGAPLGEAAGPAAEPAASPSSTTTSVASTAPAGPSADHRLELRQTIRGDITPKSVVASGHGLVFAQNMMYSHSITAYDVAGGLEATISDTVDLGAFGVEGYPGSAYQGAPVEAAFTADGKHAYVSNYSMYGPGFGPEGLDSCQAGDGTDDSFMYRVDTRSLEIDQVIAVGPVPKYVALTPDGATALVSNWCSDDVSVVDLASGTEVRRVPIGRHPRGIAITGDSTTAFVAVMGGTDIARVDLGSWDVTYLRGVGRGPRHLVLSPDDRWLYVTTNNDGYVSKLDAGTGEAVGRAATGRAPRSLAMATDGGSVYVVNYESDTVSKVRTDTMEVLQTLPTGHHPIGIAFEPVAGRVWVASYAGSIAVYDDV